MKTCKYGIFVAKIYKYALIDRFQGSAGFLDSAASLAALVYNKIHQTLSIFKKSAWQNKKCLESRVPGSQDPAYYAPQVGEGFSQISPVSLVVSEISKELICNCRIDLYQSNKGTITQCNTKESTRQNTSEHR